MADVVIVIVIVNVSVIVIMIGRIVLGSAVALHVNPSSSVHPRSPLTANTSTFRVATLSGVPRGLSVLALGL